jgi:hypothetical protein
MPAISALPVGGIAAVAEPAEPLQRVAVGDGDETAVGSPTGR